MTHVIRNIKPEGLADMLPLISPFIDKALEKAPEYTFEDIIKDVLNNEAFIFSIDNGDEVVGVAVTRYEIHPQKKYLQIHLLGGKDMTEWVSELRAKMKEFAILLGFDGVVIYGRPGWKKIFPDLRCERIILIDEIGEGV